LLEKVFTGEATEPWNYHASVFSLVKFKKYEIRNLKS